MTHALLYAVALLAPLGGALIVFFVVRKFKRERDEAKKALERYTSDRLIDTMIKANDKSMSLYGILEKCKQSAPTSYHEELDRRAQVIADNGKVNAFLEGYKDGVGLISQIGSGRNFYLPGNTLGSMPVTDVHIDWNHMAKAFEAQAAQGDTDEVYVLSPDELHQLKTDIKLHRDTHPNTSFEAKESSDGLVTVRVGGITYHIAKELFDLVEEFWCPNKGSSRNWHR